MAPKTALRYVQVSPCVPLGARGHDAYTYYVSADIECCVGQAVRIPFGKRTIHGIVIKTDVGKPRYPTKEILKVSPIVLSHVQIQFAYYIARIAHGGLGFTLRLFLPPSLSMKGEFVYSEEIIPKRRKKAQKTKVVIESSFKKRARILAQLARKTTGQAVVIVPELAMLDAYVEQFQEEIANTSTVIYHAGLLQSERKHIWNRIRNGEIKIVIGTQKALFLPYYNLSSVIIDEEQYESHKLWDQYPRLYAVRGAMQLSQLAGAELVFGSSYPSVSLRYAVGAGMCDVLRNNPISIKANIVSLSFEDRKWRRSVPDDLGRRIRAWARAGKTVLVLFNKKEASKVRETLHWKLSAQTRERVQIGTSAILAQVKQLKPDYVVWLFPELTMRAIDYRSGERTRILAARLQCVTPKKNIEIATRYQDAVVDVLTSSDDAWYAKILKERTLLSLPPVTDLVRLTIRDATARKALNRALKIRELIEPNISKKENQHIFGPYQEKGMSTTRRSKEQVVEYFLLLSGTLDDLVSLYADLPVDSADIDPHRIV